MTFRYTASSVLPRLMPGDINADNCMLVRSRMPFVAAPVPPDDDGLPSALFVVEGEPDPVAQLATAVTIAKTAAIVAIDEKIRLI